jgi:hypothetical protein
MPTLVRAGALGGLGLSRPFPGVRALRGHELLHSVSLARPWSFRIKLSFGIMGHPSC